MVAIVESSRATDVKVNGRVSAWVSASMALLGLGLLVSLYFTALQPVADAKAKLHAGDRLQQQSISQAAADSQYAAAAVSDPWSPEPWRRRAKLAYRRAEFESFRSNDLFDKAVGYLREAQMRDPQNPADELRMGDWWLAHWRTTNRQEDATQAVAAYSRAWRRYPTNAMLMADLVQALAAADDHRSAVDVARQALEQDAINRSRGHQDRYLPERMREELKAIERRGSPSDSRGVE